MQQKEISRWLKAITIVLALMGAVFFLYIMQIDAAKACIQKTIWSNQKCSIYNKKKQEGRNGNRRNCNRRNSRYYR